MIGIPQRRTTRVPQLLSWFGLALAVATAACTTSHAGGSLDAPARTPGFLGLRGEVVSQVETGRYPGAVYMAARDGRLMTEGAIGLADLESNVPMKRDAIFRMMSMTKPVTAVAVMIMVEEGKVQLDDPVSRFLPQFESYRPTGSAASPPLTLRHLLTHTLGNGFGSDPGVQTRDTTLAERMDDITSRAPQIPAGTRWQYSGWDAFDILARIVETVSGERYDRFLKRRIFDPLGMKDTGYELNSEQSTRLVGLYAAADGSFSSQSWAGGPTTYYAGGAGLYSTGPDYLLFAEMLAGRGALGSIRILQASTVDDMGRVQVPDGFPGLQPGLSWGLGMRRVTDPLRLGSALPAGAFGWSGAYGTHFWVDPSRGLASVFLINLTTARGAYSPDALAFERMFMSACMSDHHCHATRPTSVVKGRTDGRSDRSRSRR